MKERFKYPNYLFFIDNSKDGLCYKLKCTVTPEFFKYERNLFFWTAGFCEGLNFLDNGKNNL